ncbi:MAG: hypothetical protein O7B29_09400 [Deltaproteobacteria bacterium]|nr:hypothetical protein [Deltaproteobacteria bacterium]
MGALARVVLTGTLGVLLFWAPGVAEASCDACQDVIRECAKAIKVKHAKCGRSCRLGSRDRAVRELCSATCEHVEDNEDVMCKEALRECLDACAPPVDLPCVGDCHAPFESCIHDVKLEYHECQKGVAGCRENTRQNRRACKGLGRSAKRICKAVVKEAFGDCTHECAEEAAAKVRVCAVELNNCFHDCAPVCGDTFPECGGRCPPVPIVGTDRETQVCEPSEAGSGCECVSTGVLACEEAHPEECGGDCPPGFECGSVEDGLACGCIPAGNVPCGDVTTPSCDGACPPGHTCQEAFGHCVCAERPGFECGQLAGAPICAGECPSDRPICFGLHGDCECVAIPEPPECGELFDLGVCGGECPDDRPVCRDVEESCQCTEVPKPQPCGDAEGPTCHGVCPEGEMCIPDFDGVELSDIIGMGCRCVSSGGLACGELFGPPLCAGECPADAPLCVDTDAGCECRGEPEPPECMALFDGELLGLPLCGGECPPARPICHEVEGTCACTELPDPAPCFDFGGAPFPVCLGECPPELPLCREIEGTCACTELPEPVECGDYADSLFPGFPICAGECPPEHVCIPGGESCECIEFPEIPCDLYPLICEDL